MRQFIQPCALVIANAGVFAALTVASAEVAYQANDSATSKNTATAINSTSAPEANTEIELAKARRIIDSMERHGVQDPALADLKNDLARKTASTMPSRHRSSNEDLRLRTAEGRWRAYAVASPLSWDIQPFNERAEFTPQLNEELFKSQNQQLSY